MKNKYPCHLPKADDKGFSALVTHPTGIARTKRAQSRRLPWVFLLLSPTPPGPRDPPAGGEGNPGLYKDFLPDPPNFLNLQK